MDFIDDGQTAGGGTAAPQDAAYSGGVLLAGDTPWSVQEGYYSCIWQAICQGSLGDLKDTPAEPHPEYVRMAKRWEVIYDLVGGTQQMRLKAHKWLPQDSLEEDKTWASRVSRAYLFSHFDRSTSLLASRPFTKPVKFSGADNLAPTLKEMLLDADREGTTLPEHMRATFDTGIKYGMSHILVDYPKVSTDLTKEQEAKLQARPSFCAVHPLDLINWRFVSNAAGVKRLAEVRILETYVHNTKYSVQEYEAIRTITETAWKLEIYVVRKNAQGVEEKKWIQIDGGPHSFGAIPLVTFYSQRKGYLVARPPLEESAMLNARHFASMSEQIHILRFARVGILFGKGFPESMVTKFAIGPNYSLFTDSQDADLKYVEYQGQAIGAGKADLDDLERRMDSLALQPILQASAAISATGRALDEAKMSSQAQAWTEALQATYIAAFDMAAKWIKKTLPEDFSIDLMSDFTISSRQRDDILSLIEMAANNLISDETFLNEIQRRGLLAETVDLAAELMRIKKERVAAAELEARTTAAPTFKSDHTPRGIRDPKNARKSRNGTRNRKKNAGNTDNNPGRGAPNPGVQGA